MTYQFLLDRLDAGAGGVRGEGCGVTYQFLLDRLDAGAGALHVVTPTGHRDHVALAVLDRQLDACLRLVTDLGTTGQRNVGSAAGQRSSGSTERQVIGAEGQWSDGSTDQCGNKSMCQ